MPITKATHKCLLPVFDKPMVIYPLETLRGMGIREVCLLVPENYLRAFQNVISGDATAGLSISYRVEGAPTGVAHALGLTEGFADSKIVVVLCDNIFGGSIGVPAGALTDDNAYIFLKEVDEPRRFGVAELGAGDAVVRIEEKPTVPRSNLAVTGLYIYPNDVFSMIKRLRPSKRGELEITDLNNLYLEQHRLKAVRLNGFWADAGTFESLLEASLFMARKRGAAPGKPHAGK